MRTRSCPFPLRRQPQHQSHPDQQPRSKGQVIVIFGVSLLALLFFIGLAIDAGSMYVTYGQLKRAVDAAAVAAANEFKFKTGVSEAEMKVHMIKAAEEILTLQNVTVDNLHVYICTDSGIPAAFASRCPDTGAGQSPRKMVWVDATQTAPFYFLSLLGFNNMVLSTNTISEAAPVDIVIVLDTSESMGSETPGYQQGDFDPADCNTNNNCQPLKKAKDAAVALINTLYAGYDQVGVINFDVVAHNSVPLTTDMNNAINQINNNVLLHDDPTATHIWNNWRQEDGAFNPTNPEDRDGDGQDADFPQCLGNGSASPLCCYWDINPADNNPQHLAILNGTYDPNHEARWQLAADMIAIGETPQDPGFGWDGIPCDSPTLLDSYDWSGDGLHAWTPADNATSQAWINDPIHNVGLDNTLNSLTPLSTCTGCGMRAANQMLSNHGRPGSVWVIVFLSDGMVNLADFPNADTSLGITVNGTIYPNGYCSGGLHSPNWIYGCLDLNPSVRYSISPNNVNGSTRPPGSILIPNAASYDLYTPYDYARDMTDRAALTVTTHSPADATKWNPNEPKGNDIAIYSIGLGSVLGNTNAENLLRYMAAVGDDGDRVTDPCASTAINQNCGQYYFAPDSNQLVPIFENIASRIYTRITE